MKKIIITLFIVLGFYSLVSAQVKEKGDTEFGIDVGLNTSYVTNANSFGYEQSTDANVGFNVGVSGDLYFSNQWSLKVRVLYDQKGWGNGYLSYDDGTEVDGINIKVNYITIPVLANWHFGRQRNWYLDFGPYIGILTSASAGGENVKDAFNSTDGGLRADIGFKLPISEKSNFFIEAGGQAGIAGIFKDSGGSNLQNETSSLNVGISF